MKKIEKIIRSIIEEAEEPATAGNLTFENLGSVLQKIGIFQNLEFQKSDKMNQTSLSLNQSKIKPERLNAEVS